MKTIFIRLQYSYSQTWLYDSYIFILTKVGTEENSDSEEEEDNIVDETES